MLARFDRFIRKKGYANRSEAIRDLIRDALIEEDWRAGPAEGVAVVSLVYDHEELELPSRLVEMQHQHHDVVVSSLHVHLGPKNCLEVLVLRGPGEEVRRMGDALVGMKGVKHGKVFLSTGEDVLG